nr:FAD-dependent oxidoreductase [Algoriphagus sp.]
MKKITCLSLLFFGFLNLLFAQEKYDVLIVGGGASGTAAGIAAARMGSKTLIVEPTTWLGGMLTSAGVSAIDGNHRLPSGIWGEFRDSL